MAKKKRTKQEIAFEEAKGLLKEFEPCYHKQILLTMQEALELGSTKPLTKYKHWPVDVRTFVEEEYYLNAMIEDPLTHERTPIIYPLVMEHLIEMNEGDYDEIILTGGIGAAKCLGRDTPILMFDGTTKKVQDVGVGDLLMGPDSLPRRVTSTTSGLDHLYRITQNGGDSYVVNKSHILSLQYTGTSNGAKGPRYGVSKGDIRNISVTDYLALSNKNRNILKGWRPSNVDFDSRKVYDPYLLGLWLGDGTSETASFTTMDSEVVEYLQTVAQREGLILSELVDKRGNKAKRYTFCARHRYEFCNPVLNWLRRENLLKNKHVPHKYLTASREDRLLLLAGLIDTNGSLNRNGYVISQKRKNLADAVCYLARSLGFQATQSVTHVKGVEYYRTHISGHTDRIPVRIARKRASTRKQDKDVTRWGVSVDYVGVGAYYGFELEGPDRLFLLGDFTVTHNTTLAIYTQKYQLYLLSCMNSPQAYFGLDPASEIVIVFQSLSRKLAEEVDYDRFRTAIDNSPYFQEKFPRNKFVDNQLEFPKRIIVKPVAGVETGAISQNVIGGLIDEVNFMSVIENSKLAEGGVYDQATALYNSIATRRKSRFLKMGRMPGRLCLVSSRRTPGQFTDKKEEEAKTNKRIYVYDKRVFDIKPDAFGKERFYVFIGDGTRQPRLLDEVKYSPDGPVYPPNFSEEDKRFVDAIPLEFKQDFVNDIAKALRDVAGKSTLAIHPFMPRREDVAANFGRRPSLFAQETADLQNEKLRVRTQLIARNQSFPRWVHIDLGLSSDSAGLVIGHVPKFTDMSRGSDGTETLPIIEIDAALEIPPPPGKKGEIDFSSIRRILYKLRDMGLPIKWVSMDTYQSADSLQALRRAGFVVGVQSIDTTTFPYDFTKQALYDHRVLAPTHGKLVKELTSLERDFRKGKIDHPPKGSKDVSDALAGVVYGLTMRREIWAMHRVAVQQALSVAGHIADKKQEKGEEVV